MSGCRKVAASYGQKAARALSPELLCGLSDQDEQRIYELAKIAAHWAARSR